MRKTARRGALLTGAAMAMVAAQPVWAKDAPAAAEVQQTPAAGTAPEETASTTPDIIVTATKRAERLQDVPASVSVVSANDLLRQGAVRFQDYATRIPGLSLTTARTGIAQVTLRGITTGAAQPGSTTGYYIDEAPIGSVNAYTGGNAITPDLDPSDIAQIEVLKGPQGTLYGAGAVGGLFKFSTAAPNLEALEARLSAGVTSVERGEVGYSGRGTINVPLVPGQLALHVSGFYRRDAGYIDNVNPRIGFEDVNFAQVRGGRAVLAMRFSDRVRLDLSAIAQDITSNGTNTVDVDAVTLNEIYGDLKQNRFIRETGYNRFRLYNATWRVDLGAIDLLSSTTYQRIYFRELTDGTRSYGAAVGPLLRLTDLGVRLNTIKHTERWSEEARASTNGLLNGLIDLQVGFYWTHEDDINRIPNIDTFSTTTGATYPVPPLAIARIDSSYEEYSGFANARIHLGSKFDVLGGIRYSHDDQNYVQDYQGLLVGPRLVVPGTESADVTTYLVSPRFRFSDTLMVYGRVATGYRPGGPNPAPPTTVAAVPLTFQPDKLTQYEVGLKASTADRRLSLDAALFTTDWNNIQIQTSAGGFNFLVNGGSARSKGAELTLRYQPVTALSLGANVGYTDAHLTTAAPAAGGVDGDRLPYVPRWSGSLIADYTAELGPDARLTLGGSVNYVSDRVSDYSNRFPKRLPDYVTVDLRAGFDLGAVTITAFAKNLTDKRAFNVVTQEGLAPSNTAGAFYSASVIQPRTIGAEVAFRF